MNNETPLEKLKKAYERFLMEVDALRKEYLVELNKILKEVDEEKLKNLREKLK